MIKENEIENIEHLISSEIVTKLKRLKTEGTKEWADSNVNIASGCSKYRLWLLKQLSLLLCKKDGYPV
jgi:hypothetical protein